jgi:LysM repeat protein
MSNPNPFVPKGSLLEQQSHRRSRLKLAVFCVLAVSVTGLVAMLIQGCKRTPDVTADNPSSLTDTNTSATDLTSNTVPDSNAPAYMPPPSSNSPTAYTPPPPPPTPPPMIDTGATGGSEYVVVAGDTLGKIAKHNGVSLKALEAANPGVDSKHLKVKQKLVIPASARSVDTAASPGAMMDSEGETYTVKAGDTLSKIAKAHHTTIKALEAANNLGTTKISVGKKLKLPAKAEAAPVVPVDNTPPAPVMPPPSAPAPSPAPASPAPAGN